jgi:hypothetical protein
MTALPAAGPINGFPTDPDHRVERPSTMLNRTGNRQKLGGAPGVLTRTHIEIPKAAGRHPPLQPFANLEGTLKNCEFAEEVNSRNIV